jgi:uncharacterized integral membrane protein
MERRTDRSSSWTDRIDVSTADVVRIALAGLAVLYAIIFIASNTAQVTIDFVFITADVSLVVALGLVAVLGVVAGAALIAVRRHRGHR